MNMRCGAAYAGLLRNDIVSAGLRGDLRQMRDAQHLTRLCDLAHLFADGSSRFAPDIRIDLVKDQHRNLVHRCENGLEGKHYASEFARRSDCAERTRRLAGIWSELKFYVVEAGGGEFLFGG